MRNIGTPVDSSRIARKFRIWRCRVSMICGSSVSPSTPQFQDRLSLFPSLLC
jgi:hypothetical protein